MYSTSAADAIAPAWRRTREVLFEHRSFRLFFKLAAVATLAELSNGFQFNGNVGRAFNQHSGSGGAISHLITAAAVVLIVGIVLVALVVVLAIFYSGSRMQLVTVDVVGGMQTGIAPLWRRYGSATWRWIGLKVLLFFALMLAIGVLILPFVLYFVVSKAHHNPFESGGMVASAVLLVVLLVLVLIALILGFVAAFCLVTDFVPVFMATENTSIRVSMQYVVAICRHEPGQVFLYLLLRFVLGIASGIGFFFVLFVAILIAAIPLGGGGVAVYFGFRHGGAGAHAMMIAAAVLGAVVLAAWILCVYICAVGTMATFFRAYALYFLGARFPSVRALLESSVVLPQIPVFEYPVPPGMPPPSAV